MGDFNFDATRTWGEWRHSDLARKPDQLENSALRWLLPQFTDVWPAVRGAEPGLTFDGANNPYVRDAEERMRYDRVMAKGLRPAQIDLLGEPDLSLPPEDHPVPSDHFGLFAVLEQEASDALPVTSSTAGKD